MIEVIGDTRAELGESPVWDDGLLHWVDLWGGAVHTTHAATGLTTSAYLEPPVSVVLLDDEGGLVIGCGAAVRRVGGEVLADGLACEGMRINDAAAAPDGGLWFGTMGWTAASDRIGALSSWDSGVVVPEVALANGIAWSPDGTRLWFADSKRGTVTGYDAGVAEVVITIAAADGMPDGLCVDTEGAVWVALFGGGAVRRYSPDGALLTHLPLPVRHPTSCAFGGPHLYVTTARRPEPSPTAGAVLRLDPGVDGAPVPRLRLDQFRRTP